MPSYYFVKYDDLIRWRSITNDEDIMQIYDVQIDMIHDKFIFLDTFIVSITSKNKYNKLYTLKYYASKEDLKNDNHFMYIDSNYNLGQVELICLRIMANGDAIIELNADVIINVL